MLASSLSVCVYSVTCEHTRAGLSLRHANKSCSQLFNRRCPRLRPPPWILGLTSTFDPAREKREALKYRCRQPCVCVCVSYVSSPRQQQSLLINIS